MQKSSFHHLPAEIPVKIQEKHSRGIHLPQSSESNVELARFRSRRLDDLCFRYLRPIEFRRTKKIRESLLNDTGMDVSKIIAAVEQVLKEENIGILGIQGRSKGIHSTYRKLRKYDMDITRVYDLIAVRVLVDDIDSCYQALSVLHKKYKPVTGRVKDYILRPKRNGYQSLHTTVTAPPGVFEVQFRTKAMHTEAEFGFAAHWLYDLMRKRRMKNFFPADRKTLSVLEARFLHQQKKKILQQVPVEEAVVFWNLRSSEQSFLK